MNHLLEIELGKVLGGVATLVDKAQFPFTSKVKEGDANDEFVITKHSQFKTPINVVNWYGEIESRATNKEIEDRWYRLLSEITKIEMKNEHIIFIGDMNKHVGDIIKNNHPEVSYGGKLIRDFLESRNFVLVNGLNVTEGGPFTRYNPSDPLDDSSKSCLDLIMISNDLVKYVDRVQIDSKFEFTPGIATKNGLCYTDHYSILLTMKNIPLSSKKRSKSVKTQMWNLNKEGGWEKYFTLTESNENLSNAVSNESDNTKIMKAIDDELTKVKFRSFGKVTYNQSVKANKTVKQLMKEKSTLVKAPINDFDRSEAVKVVDCKISDEILREEGRMLEKAIVKLKVVKDKKGPAAALFSLKDHVTGCKKGPQEVISMIDPESNAEIADPDRLKTTFL